METKALAPCPAAAGLTPVKLSPQSPPSGPSPGAHCRESPRNRVGPTGHSSFVLLF